MKHINIRRVRHVFSRVFVAPSFPLCGIERLNVVVFRVPATRCNLLVLFERFDKLNGYLRPYFSRLNALASLNVHLSRRVKGSAEIKSECFAVSKREVGTIIKRTHEQITHGSIIMD